eukprot:scaffold57368_cov36-Phaeocystis_antarctica.AAC.1
MAFLNVENLYLLCLCCLHDLDQPSCIHAHHARTIFEGPRSAKAHLDTVPGYPKSRCYGQVDDTRDC